MDGDGDLDIYLVNAAPLGETGAAPSGGDALFLNDGAGRFTRAAKNIPPGPAGAGMGCVFGDLDNDGDADLFLTRYGPDRLLRNDGRGVFTDVTKGSGLGSARWGMGAALADYDLDGDLDIYVPNYVDYRIAVGSRTVQMDRDGNLVPLTLNPFASEAQGNFLYRNDGNLRFTDVTSRAGVGDAQGRGMQAVFADFDHDGDPDLYVANDISTNILFRNNGDGTFSDVASESWTADFRSSMGLAVGDYDNDGDQDMLVSHWTAQMNALYMNVLEQGLLGEDGLLLHFSDVAEPAELGEISMDQVGWGGGFFDADNDGHLDIFIANGSTFERPERRGELIGQKNMLFRNNGDGSYSDVSARCGPAFARADNSRGAAFGDYDGDGDIDILVNNMHGAPQLLRNDWAGGNHWLRVRLRGRRSNRDGIGARIEMFPAGGARQTRMIVAGDSFLSGSPPAAHFGLGKASAAERLVIRWPSGREQTLRGVPADRVLDVEEPE